MYDIAIIGGGPAGATLARLVGKRYRVLLLEKRTFKAPLYNGIQKCCGGLIAPDAQKMLASFGLGLPKSVILSPQMFAVRTIDMDNKIERLYQRHYINIDREEFDKWLETKIPAAVDIVNGCLYKSHEVYRDCVKLKYIKDNKEYEVKTKLLIGADGAYSKVRRNSYPDHEAPKEYIAIQEWFQTKQNVDYYGAIFDSEITDFYSWIIPKEDNIIVGSALIPNDNVHEKFDLLKHKLEKYGFELNNSIRRNGAFMLRPSSLNQLITGHGRVGLIGEAAGFISPSSAEGLSYAFKSALALSKAVSHRIEGWSDDYYKYTAGLRANILLKNIKAPFMYNKQLRGCVMKSGLMSISKNMDY